MGTLSKPNRILITGASRGIGRATALLLARAGHTLVLAARDEAALGRVAREVAAAGGRAEVAVMDVTDDLSVESAIQRVLATGHVDVLVNNAGAADQCDFVAQDSATRRAEMEVNYFGPLRVTRALLPAFMRRGEGLVVNVSSLLGTVATPTTANYCASKAALEAWSHALRAEVGRFGVRVVVFMAPHTDTEMGRGTKFEGVTSLPVDYTAKELVRAVERAPRKYAASPVYRLLLRLARFFPVFMEARVGASARPYLLADPLAGRPTTRSAIVAT